MLHSKALKQIFSIFAREAKQRREWGVAAAEGAAGSWTVLRHECNRTPRSPHVTGCELTQLAQTTYVFAVGTHQYRWKAARVAIAVAALYALALQAILGGMLLASPIGSAHPLCLQTTGSADTDPEKAPIAHDHLACCTAAPYVTALQAPALTAMPIVWPQRLIADVSWRPEIVTIPRAPPRFRHSARAPPVV